MINKNIPPEHWSKRQAILILEQDKIDLLYEIPEGKELLLNSECCILTLPLDENNKTVQELINSNLDKEGAMLVQNPFYRDRYEELPEISQKFAMEKYFIFSALCRYLGAKEVIVEEFEIRKNTVTQKVNLDGKVNITKFDTELKKEINDEVFQKLNINLTFPGGEPDIEAACSLLQNTRLITKNPEMYSLIEMRKGKNNRLKSSQVMLNLSEETNSIFQFIGTLNLPNYLTKIKIHYENALTEKSEYTLKMLVTF